MIFDEYRIFDLELYLSELIETSFSNFQHVLMSREFHQYNLSLQKTKFKSLKHKGKFIQLNRKWNSIY